MHPDNTYFVYPRRIRVFQSLLFLILPAGLHVFSQQLPIGYISYYSQKGNDPAFLKTLFIEPEKNILLNKERTYVVLNPALSDSNNLLPNPSCRGIIADKIFGEYIIEFEYKIQVGSGGNSSGFYFLSPVKSDNTYYATVFTNDTIAFYYVKDGTVNKNEARSSKDINPGWNKVRIKRDMLNRKLEITLNDNINNNISFTDKDLVMGFVGFGTQELSSYLRNVNIWAPTAFSDTLYHGK